MTSTLCSHHLPHNQIYCQIQLSPARFSTMPLIASSMQPDEGSELQDPSIIEDAGPYDSPCGYCKSEGDSSRSHGMMATQMSPSVYQDLLDVGWRRSGTFLYKVKGRQLCKG